jgi:hypothetical protein
MSDLTPPAMKRYRVIVDSPELPERHDFDLDARVEVEAQVKGAEVALTTTRHLPRRLARLSREDQVTAVAGFAQATEL